MGRRHLVSEPWASSPYLTVGLCNACHRFATDEQYGVREFTRKLAVDRLSELAVDRGMCFEFGSEWDSIDKIRHLIRELGDYG